MQQHKDKDVARVHYEFYEKKRQSKLNIYSNEKCSDLYEIARDNAE